MLNDEQSRDYDRAKKLQKYFSGNATVYSSYKPFAKWVTKFTGDVGSVESSIPQKDASGKSTTQSKADLKQTIADEANDICAIARSYALDVGNASLAAAMNYKTNAISKLKEGDVLGFAQNIYDSLTPLLTDADFQDYGITKKDLDKLQKDAVSYNDMIGEAGIIDSGSSIANKNIDAAFKDIDDDIRHFDLLINYFKAKEPNFYAGYHINSAVDNSGIHHSGIEGVITNSKTEPVEGARISLLGTKKSALTDLLGHYQLIRVDTGDYKVEVSADGYTAKMVIVHIERGRIGKLNITL